MRKRAESKIAESSKVKAERKNKAQSKEAESSRLKGKIARGSLYETMTLLEIFRRVKWITDSEYKGLELDGIEIASMIKGLINSLRKF